MLALERIKDNVPFNGDKWNSESQRAAFGLHAYMQKFAFIVTLVICKEIMAHLSAVTISLQGPTLSIVEAYKSVLGVIETLQNIRLSISEKHHLWFKKATDLAELVNIVPSKPRTCGTQSNRENFPCDSIIDYYRLAVTIPCLDEVISDLERRFAPENIPQIKGFYIISALMEKYPTEWKSNSQDFMHTYCDDMVNPYSCDAELDQWEMMWTKRKIATYPASVENTISSMPIGIFPNIHRMLILLGVSAVTTCSCERSISVQRRLKTYLRSTMGQERYNALALMHIHYEMNLDNEKILDQLNRKYPKRLRMGNVFADDDDE